MKRIKIKLNNNTFECDPGIPLIDIINANAPDQGVTLCKANYEYYGLFHKMYTDSTIFPLDISTPEGNRVYQKTAVFVLLKAVKEAYPSIPLKALKVAFSIGNGLYIEMAGYEVSKAFVKSIKEKMQEIIDRAIPIKKEKMGVDQAIELFGTLGMTDKINLLRYRRSSTVTIYTMEDLSNYFFDFVSTNSKDIRSFNLIQYKKGMVLVTPKTTNPKETEPFSCSKKLFNALYDYNGLMSAADISTVSDFNDHITRDGFLAPILMQEALMEKQISDIARKIASDKKIKIVLIAGPSSSGKTTFSHRLSVQLKVNGLKSYPIATDNYYKPREYTPIDENGMPDYECLEAMDIEQFVSDCKSLLSGNSVSMPTYNFKSGSREYLGDTLQLTDNSLIIAEGIHCLDPKMIGGLPKENVFKIFISPMSQFNIDNIDFISSNDIRLIRRIIRDSRDRSLSASATIEMWSSVRRGEEKYILPFRESADAIFNSSMIYEIGALKPYAEALLFGINKDEPSYGIASRLLKMLDYFLTIPSHLIPANSLLSEFVGGNIFGV
ncbi:MAG: nucleoside kinase [Lachnospiraceae bacterium]|nr:nucleoside kinase [Lachnospiraceae bacterium]